MPYDYTFIAIAILAIAIIVLGVWHARAIASLSEYRSNMNRWTDRHEDNVRDIDDRIDALVASHHKLDGRIGDVDMQVGEWIELGDHLNREINRIETLRRARDGAFDAVPTMTAKISGVVFDYDLDRDGSLLCVIDWTDGSRTSARFSGADYTIAQVMALLPLRLSYAQALAIGSLHDDRVEEVEVEQGAPSTTSIRKGTVDDTIVGDLKSEGRFYRFVVEGSHVLREILTDSEGTEFHEDTRVHTTTRPDIGGDQATAAGPNPLYRDREGELTVGYGISDMARDVIRSGRSTVTAD